MGIRQRGKFSKDADAIYDEIGAAKNATKKFAQAMQNTMAGVMGGDAPGAALPAQVFLLAQENRGDKAFVTLGFYIEANTTTVICYLIAGKKNTGTKADARKAVKECRWEDISDEERAGGYMTREFDKGLEYETVYKVVRTVAKNDEQGITATIKLPDESENPYLNPPPFPIVNRYNASRQDLGTDACFFTGDSENPAASLRDFCAGTNETDTILPRPHPTNYVVANKVTKKGVKPTFQVLVHKNARNIRIQLIKTSDIGTGAEAFEEKIADNIDIDATEMRPGSQSNERSVRVKFNAPLDEGVEYKTIFMSTRGDNVGGPGIDFARNPDVAIGLEPIVATGQTPFGPTSTGTFVAGTLSGGDNPLLKEDTPFVSESLDVNGNLIDFVLKNRGVKATFHMLTPVMTTDLRARIVETIGMGGADLNKKPLRDDWDDVQTTNDGIIDAAGGTQNQIKISRQFGPTLDFNRTYRLKALRADGPDVGLGVDFATYNPPTGVTFRTPGPDGTFTDFGGSLTFGGTVAALTKYKKNGNGVLVGMKIFAPRGSEKITVRIQRLIEGGGSQAANTNEILDYTFIDTAADIAASPDSSFSGVFGIKLDPDETPLTHNYGVVRLIAEGEGINESGQGGKNPDIARAPIAKAPTGTYLATFTTGKAIGFGNATVPAQPLLADLSNLTENDEAKVSFTVFASSFKNAINSGGTGTNGVVTFGDVNAVKAFVVVNRADQAGDDGTKDKQVFFVTVDPSTTSAVVELEGLKTGKRYYIPRVGLESGTDIAKTAAAAPVTTTIRFRAGFEISLAGVTLSFGTILKIDGRSSLVPVTYNITSGSVLPRNLQLFKDIQGKTGGFRESNTPIVLKDNQLNATTGTHPFMFTTTHPAGAQIRYQAILNPINGGGSPIIAYFPTANPSPATYDDTADDPGLTDTGPPQYSGFRTDGNQSTSPFRLPKMLVKWKPNGLRVRFNLPDVNMFTHVLARIFFVFSYQTRPLPALVLDQLAFYNPNNESNVSTTSGAVVNPLSLSADDDTNGIDIGKAAGDTFPERRPNASGDAGDLPAGFYSTLTAYQSDSGLKIPTLQAFVVVKNSVGKLVLQSNTLFFSSGFAERVGAVSIDGQGGFFGT